GLLGGGEPLVVLSYEHAQALAEGGMSKRDVKRFLFEHARLPLKLLGSQTAAGIRRAQGDALLDDALRAAYRPEDIMIVVAGGDGGDQLRGGGVAAAEAQPLARAVDLHYGRARHLDRLARLLQVHHQGALAAESLPDRL